MLRERQVSGDAVMHDSNELILERASQENGNLKVIGQKKKKGP